MVGWLCRLLAHRATSCRLTVGRFDCLEQIIGENFGVELRLALPSRDILNVLQGIGSPALDHRAEKRDLRVSAPVEADGHVRPLVQQVEVEGRVQLALALHPTEPLPFEVIGPVGDPLDTLRLSVVRSLGGGIPENGGPGGQHRHALILRRAATPCRNAARARGSRE